MTFAFQAIFDRNRKDELPGLQLEWIDGICAPLYEVTLASPEVLRPSSCHTRHTAAADISRHCPSSAIVLTDASNEIVTNNYSTFFSATDSSAKKIFFFLYNISCKL